MNWSNIIAFSTRLIDNVPGVTSMYSDDVLKWIAAGEIGINIVLKGL